MKAALYLRVSTDEQVKGYSLDVQKEYLLEYVERKKWKLYKIYSDKGVSGSSQDRPELKKLLSDAREKKFDVVVVYKLDRFSRDLGDIKAIVEELQSIDISFESATEPELSGDASNNLIFHILGSFAQFERERIIERVIPGMIKGVKQGNWQGARYAPYGYCYNKKEKLLEIDPKAAEIVKTIYTMYLLGKSTSEITAYLYRKGYKTQTGIKFHSKLVCDILKNEIYIGNIVWKKRYYDKKEKTKGGFGKGYRYLAGKSVDVIRAKGKHEPIISEEDFKRVQLRLANNRKNNRAVFNKYEHLLSGIIKCGECGHRFIGSTCPSNHRTGARKKWYRCRLKQETKRIECNCKNVVAAPFDQFALDILDKIVSQKTIKEKRYASLMKVIIEPDDETLVQIQDMKKELANNREKQKKLTNIYLEGQIGKGVYYESQEPLKSEGDKLNRKVSSLELKLIEKEDTREYHSLLQSVLENFSSLEDNLNINEKKAVLKLVFKEIVVTDGKLTGYELYEPFKTLLKEVDLECQIKKIKPRMKQKDAVCTYARSDDLLYRFYNI